ncbi:VCBS repeat-containing protein [Limnohabitans sp. TS-CS-82]|uniref:FG-GAP repeat domain-containing protein n=1 Tax=Limnohabitans sp. TS-CS-82 TaxID=2094193 RepID=UPI00137538C3|nr:VCBS repeat-containing protein [Limnohabitans sp. TS-CS-82]
MKNMFPGWLVWTALALTGCGGGGGSAGPDAKVAPTPLAVLATSYENKNLRVAALDVSQIPVMAADAALWTQVPESLAFGDFFQEGKYSAFVAANQANGAAKAYFLKKNDAGTWTDATADLLTDRTVCTHVVQAISADFNGDGKPDIYVACGGTAAMQQVFFMSRTGSGQTGYVRQETGFGLQSWGAAAGDIDGDGDIDLVVTDNNLSVALLNDGLKNGASSFTKDTTGRVPTSGGPPINGVVPSFPTLHRKVFLIPQANANPDLVIAGTGAGANSTAIYLKNNSVSGTQGHFYVSPSTGASAMFEDKLINSVAVKFYDVVADSQSLYVLAKNVGVESAQTATEMVVLKYESASTISSSNVLLNLQGGNNGVLSLPSGYAPTDGFVSQFKINMAGHLVAFDGACAIGSQRCAFDIAP